MERLVVKNFLLLKDVEIEIKKYNFVLGPQASGKSILAKLLYFIYKIPHLISRIIILTHNKKIDEIYDLIFRKFTEFFPEKYWIDDEFLIEYRLNDFYIIIKKIKGEKIFITFSKEFQSELDGILDDLLQFQENRNNKDAKEISNVDYKKKINNFYEKVDIKLSSIMDNSNMTYKGESIFVPSSRSIFSMLSIMPANSSELFGTDFILNEFSSDYRKAKDLYYNDFIHPPELKTEEFEALESGILKGKYIYNDDEEFLNVNGKNTSLNHLSSGQQESLPLILMLKFSTALGGTPMFIEEPEAHLFPESQAKMMSLFTYLDNENNFSFFITTHSPYLLSILNNFLYGSKLIKEKKISEEQYIEITGGARPINTSDVNAFTLSDGKAVTLMDEDGVFVDSIVLDSASTIINEMYDKFIDVVLD